MKWYSFLIQAIEPPTNTFCFANVNRRRYAANHSEVAFATAKATNFTLLAHFSSTDQCSLCVFRPDYFFAALTLSQRNFCAAAILARPSALIFFRAFFTGFTVDPFFLAQRFLCAADIFARTAALMVLLLLVLPAAFTETAGDAEMARA